MKFEERRTMSRGELAALLRKLAEKLEKGILDYTRGEAPIPGHLDVELEYKEEEQEGKFELELRWARGEAKEAVKAVEAVKPVLEPAKPKRAETEACEQLPPAMDTLKSDLKKLFKAVQVGLEAGRMPEMRDAAKMRELNAQFDEYSSGRGWREEMRAFTAKLVEFEFAVKKGDLPSAQRLIEELRVAKKECHRIYRWKE